MLRTRTISWSLIMIISVMATTFALFGCEIAEGKIARVESMHVTSISLKYDYSLIVELKPTSLAKPNTNYVVELYEKGKFRSTKTVSWNKPEINVQYVKSVEFPISRSEYDAYAWKDVSNIFTVEVRVGDGSTISDSQTPKPTPKPTASPVSMTPIITSVSNISATQTQTFTIQGKGFGTKEPYRGNSPYIEIIDVTIGMHAGHDANWVELNVAQWTDSQIIISGFVGSYGGPGRSLHVGDQIQINVWNAQSGLGPAVYTVICSAP